MKQYRILIVDDEERFANMLASRLSLRDCVCEVCYRGQEALDLIGREDFFLILLDLHLPDIYGVEVLSQIKQSGCTTPVIILTGHGTDDDRRKCLSLGAYDFVHKPLKINELMAVLKTIEENPA